MVVHLTEKHFRVRSKRPLTKQKQTRESILHSTEVRNLINLRFTIYPSWINNFSPQKFTSGKNSRSLRAKLVSKDVSLWKRMYAELDDGSWGVIRFYVV